MTETQESSPTGHRTKRFTSTASSLILITVTLGLTAFLIWYGYVLSNKVRDLESQWIEFNRDATATSYALNKIESNLGYGGFIHHFKNYILRQDPTLVPLVKEKIQEINAAIEEYPKFTEHDDDRKALQQIKNSVDLYAAKFAIAQQLVTVGKQIPQEIDSQVKVDDTPALEALEYLKEHVLTHRVAQEQKTEQQLEKTLGFLNRGALLIPVLLIAGGLLIIFMRKLVISGQQLQAASQHMNDIFNAAPDAMLIVTTDGMIEDVNIASVDLFGYDKSELIGMDVEQLMPERFRNRHMQFRKSSFDSPRRRPMRQALELLALTKDGDELDVEIGISYTLRDGTMYAVTILRDVRIRKEADKTLRRSQDVMQKAQQIARFGSWEWNIQTGSLVWSDEIYRIFGLQPQEFAPSYDAFLERIHPEDRAKVVDAVNAAVVHDQAYDMEHRILYPSGIERVVVEKGEVFRNDKGEAVHMVGTVRDITQEKIIETELRLADNVFQHTAEAILVADKSGRILRVNNAFTAITGYSSEEAIGKKPGELLNSGRHDKLFYESLWKTLLDTGNWRGEIWDRRKNGELFPADHNISRVTNVDGKVIQYISIFSDVTEEKRAAEHIHNLAQYDQLTKLPNRMLFNDRLQHAISRAKRAKWVVGLMFIDLDRFKSVNDTLGHHAGDILLQEVAIRISRIVRAQDTVARLGGDEFTVILEEMTHAEDAATVAKKLLSALQQKIVIDGNDIVIGGSIGISIFPNDGETPQSIIKSADMAMYQAKKQGRNRYQFFTNELAYHAQKRFHMENRLRYAIENGELEVYYQPQIDLSSGNLVGAEALVRWNDPNNGLVSPAEFIPFAEESGLIEPLGNWVLKTACRQAKLWRDAGYTPLRMTVNVAGQQIIQGSIVESTQTTLEETGLSPDGLELEITESFVMEHPEQGVATLNALRDLGVSLAIDDFGTGYSSLSYLKRLPIDRLKIDRSFVMDIPHDKDDEAIVSTIIAMAKNLGLTVIAEGVESKKQIHFLYGQGCFEVQGYYFSKPIPGDEFIQQFLVTSANTRRYASL
jgi:diguanylate cyclase (GGDEF)-like protein/PAS domain S-box-containing protein